ncbi:MAG: hypothetical protein K2X82_15535 [Gemmataceae bacterium]|nr:hypothetical protein [Gemmataceae bacterium]
MTVRCPCGWPYSSNSSRMSYSISTRFALRKSRNRWAKGLRYEAIRTSGVCSSSSILIVKQ